MQVEWWTYILAGVVGVIAGIINTLAGSGSLLTLPMFVLLGLPADVANGTNRVGVAFQCAVGVWTLRRGRKFEIRRVDAKLILPTVVGGAFGALAAVQMTEFLMRLTIAAVLLGSLVLMVWKPNRFLQKDSVPKDVSWGLIVGFLGVGLYGGFIQASVGVLILIGLVMGAGYDAVRANGLKLFMTLLFTLVAIPIFALNNQIDWTVGGLMAAGQGLGAYGAARMSLQNENAGLWIQRLLFAVILGSAAHLLWTSFFQSN